MTVFPKIERAIANVCHHQNSGLLQAAPPVLTTVIQMHTNHHLRRLKTNADQVEWSTCISGVANEVISIYNQDHKVLLISADRPCLTAECAWWRSNAQIHLALDRKGRGWLDPRYPVSQNLFTSRRLALAAVIIIVWKKGQKNGRKLPSSSRSWNQNQKKMDGRLPRATKTLLLIISPLLASFVFSKNRFHSCVDKD